MPLPYGIDCTKSKAVDDPEEGMERGVVNLRLGDCNTLQHMHSVGLIVMVTVHANMQRLQIKFYCPKVSAVG